MCTLSHRSYPWLAVGSLFFAANMSPAAAGDYAFGDWNGERERLAALGVTLNFDYTSELAHNVIGGSKQLTRNAGQLVLESQFDLDKLWGWHGANFVVTITERDGNNLNTDANLNELLQSQEVYGRDQTWRLTQMWYGQKLFDDRLEIKLGRLPVGSDFSIFECSFMSLAFCGDQSGNLVGGYWYNYPMSQWAALAKWWVSPHFYLKAGAYQVDPIYQRVSHSFDLRFAGTTGALFPAEFGWTPTFGDGLAGSYVVGGWYTNAPQTLVYNDGNGRPAGLTGLPFGHSNGAYGAYITVSQQLSHGDRANALSGLRMFLNATQADHSTATNERTLAIGAIYRGIGARANDEIGLALDTTKVNDRVGQYRKQLFERTGEYLPRQGSEYIMELFYGWQPSGWLTVRPNVQWVHHPGGVVATKDVWVLGLKSLITF